MSQQGHNFVCQNCGEVHDSRVEAEDCCKSLEKYGSDEDPRIKEIEGDEYIPSQRQAAINKIKNLLTHSKLEIHGITFDHKVQWLGRAGKEEIFFKTKQQIQELVKKFKIEKQELRE
jgi:hypothetical protein